MVGKGTKRERERDKGQRREVEENRGSDRERERERADEMRSKKKSFNIIRNVINEVVKTKIHLSWSWML